MDGLKNKPRADDRQEGGDHYRYMQVTPWQAMESCLSDEGFRGFLLGNAIKYCMRADRKFDRLTDIKKARHYLDKLIELEEGQP